MAKIKDYDEDLSAPKILRRRDSKGRFIKKDLPPYIGPEQVLKPKNYYHFDSHGKYAGSSMNGDAIVCLGSTLVNLILIGLVFIVYPIVFIFAILDQIEEYPFKKYAIPYIFILVAWFIIMGGAYL